MVSADSMVIAAFLRPFVLFILCLMVLYPIRKRIERKMRDGKLKRLLLFRLN